MLNKKALRKEYNELDKRLAEFRKRWNKKAMDDLKFALEKHQSKGKQDELPTWWETDVRRWRELRKELGIRD